MDDISSKIQRLCNIDLLLKNERLQLFNVSERTVLDYCNTKEERISLDILVQKGPMEMAKFNIPSTSRSADREHVPKEKRHLIEMAPTPQIRTDHTSSKRPKLSTALKKYDPLQPTMSLAVQPVLI